MKFRAVILEPQIMKEFLNTILTLSKLTKECVMTISESKIHFIVNEESSSSAPLVWVEIECSSYFNEYIMSGVNDKYTDILLSFNPANMARAITILRNPVTFVKIKLTSKQFSCLTIEIELPSVNTSQSRRIIHDVPVNLTPLNEWDLYKLPRLPNSQIIITMPPLRVLRAIIDKSKNFSPSVTFCATGAGELSIISESDQTTVAFHHLKLEIKKLDHTQFDNNIQNDKDIEASCLVDCKKAYIFLSGLQFSNVELCLGIVQNHIVKMESNFNSGMKMICVIPAVCV